MIYARFAVVVFFSRTKLICKLG